MILTSTSDRKYSVRRKVVTLVLFLIYLVIVGLGSTSSAPYSKTSDLVLLSVYLAFLAILSIVVLREKWTEWHYPQARHYLQARETILRRWWRWVTDDPRSSS
jgi:hypothetical protein